MRLLRPKKHTQRPVLNAKIKFICDDADNKFIVAGIPRITLFDSRKYISRVICNGVKDDIAVKKCWRFMGAM